jgi:hypothetical protein
MAFANAGGGKLVCGRKKDKERSRKICYSTTSSFNITESEISWDG